MRFAERVATTATTSAWRPSSCGEFLPAATRRHRRLTFHPPTTEDLSMATYRHSPLPQASSGRWWTSARLYNVALLLLCSAYLLGGLTKLSDFAAAQAEMAHFGLAPAGAFAAASIATELIA